MVYHIMKKYYINKTIFSYKTENIQQEVLVLTQTSFAQKALIGHNGGYEKTFLAEEPEKGF